MMLITVKSFNCSLIIIITVIRIHENENMILTLSFILIMNALNS